MVADLLEPHQEGEDGAPALHSVDFLELASEILHRLLVKRRLLAAQGTEDVDLGLVRQIRDDALVGFHAPQDVGTREVAERSVWILRAFRLPGNEFPVS